MRQTDDFSFAFFSAFVFRANTNVDKRMSSRAKLPSSRYSLPTINIVGWAGDACAFRYK